MKNNLAHGHSFTGRTTKSSHAYRREKAVNDKLFKFIAKSRTNTLPTEKNIATWFPQQGHSGKCKLCGEGGTLNHTLNNCHRRSTRYTWRHNILVQRIAKEIEHRLHPSLIKQSCAMHINGLSADCQRMLPDIHADVKMDIKMHTF